jgi:hypothetical protein
MEKASDGSFARITRKTAEDDDDDYKDEKDWGRALNRYEQLLKKLLNEPTDPSLHVVLKTNLIIRESSLALT